MLFVASFAVILLGKVDTMVADRARVSLGDVLAPIYAALRGAGGAGSRNCSGCGEPVGPADRKRALAGGERNLRKWQSVALALDAENQRLKAELNWFLPRLRLT